MDFETFAVNYIIINGHKFQVQHIAPRAAMGLSSNNPDLISPTLRRLVAEGKWTADSTVYNLIALPTDEARAAATGVTRHNSKNRKAALVLPAAVGIGSGHDGG